MKKKLYLIRGLPGSGKSKLGLTIVGENHPQLQFEADQFFTLTDGTYQFEKEKIGEAHLWCQGMVHNAMIDGWSPIVVSNTFSQRWEMKAYYAMAELYDYEVTEITMTGKLHGNVHEVPEEVIQRMIERWQWWSKKVTERFNPVQDVP